MDERILKEVGLSDAEIKVFLELLKVDSAMASEISKKVGVYRTNVYDILESLIQKGLVSYIIKSNRKHFLASRPEKILQFLREKQEKIKKQEEKIRQLIPILVGLRKPKEEELKAEIYRGKEGLKTLFEDILNEGKDYVCFGYSAVSQKILPYFFIHWHKRRVKLKIRRKLLTKEQMRGSKVVKLPLTETKYLPDKYNTPISTMIYGNKVWVLIPSDDDHISLLIDSKKLSQSFLTYFNELWNVAKS